MSKSLARVISLALEAQKQGLVELKSLLEEELVKVVWTDDKGQEVGFMLTESTYEFVSTYLEGMIHGAKLQHRKMEANKESSEIKYSEKDMVEFCRDHNDYHYELNQDGLPVEKLVDDFIDQQLEQAKEADARAAQRPIPRQYSLIKFDPITLGVDKAVELKRLGSVIESTDTLVFLGEIPNQPGHCVILNVDTENSVVGLHTCDFVELTEEEV